ncbi:MAG: adenylosuccinate synthase [Halobacteriales archaeon]|nr:adenylosuccinate synthase [Halobacteriales archaeon]
MTVTIVGAQLGDEGKGGIVDVYGDAADIVVRYQGGDNAGHTVVHEGNEYKLSLVPSGAVRGKVGVLGNGCVVNPETLFDELSALRERGLDPDVRVARRAHVIMPYHRVLDGIEEKAKSESDDEIGTTGRGIGPTYEDKAGRRGIRIGDLLAPDVLRDRLERVVPEKRAIVEDVFGVPVEALDNPDALDVDAMYEHARAYGEQLAGQTVNAGQFIAEARSEGKQVMFEGAQGTIIDIDHGNYPYVTSSNPTAGGAAVGSGVSPGVVGHGEVLGIVKGYLTRVGSGPLPTELGGVEGDTPGYGEQGSGENEDLATYIREEGGEYGTVTGRPRRVAWLDMPMLRHSARVNGFTGLAINHIDVLAGLDEVKVGHSYTLDTAEQSSASNRNAPHSDDGEEMMTMPATTEEWSRCEANFRTFDGWEQFDSTAVAESGYDAIPANARAYLDYVSDELDTPVYCVGVGPGREETVVAEDVW